MKARYAKITRQIIFSYAALILTILFGPILIFLLTRNLTIEGYGVYSLLSATVVVLSIILELGISHYIIARLSGTAEERRTKELWSLTLFEFSFLLFFTALVFLTPLHKYVMGILKLESYAAAFQLIFAIIFVSAIYRVFSGYFVAEQKIELERVLSFLEKNLWVFFLIVFFLITNKLTISSVIGLWLAGEAITVLLAIHFIRRYLFKQPRLFDSAVVQRAMVFGAPLVPFLIGSWIITVGDKYLLNHYLGAGIVGLYSLPYSLASLIVSLSVVVISVLYPYIAERWNKGKDYDFLLNVAVKYGLMVVIPLTIGVFALREAIITLISGPRYLDSIPIVIPLVAFPFFAFMNYIYTQILMLQNRTKLIAAVYLTGGTLNIILNLILIPSIGMYGAAASTVVSYAFITLLLFFPARAKMKLNYGFLKVPRLLVASILVGIFFFFASPEVAATKIIVMFAGAILYGLLLFVFKFFTKEELAFIRGLLKKS